VSAPRRPFRLLHTSDVHLGSYDYGSGPHIEERRELSEERFRRVIDVGRAEQVDLFIIAGDFFDHARVSEETLRFAAAEIARIEVPTIIVPGNHDHVGKNSVYDRIDMTQVAQNLIITRSVEGETVTFGALDLEVWARSHLEHDPDFSPFIDAPGRGDAPWHIAVGHGHYMHPRSGDHPSFHIREHHFTSLDYDYVALGHWEQQTRIAAGGLLAAYSGAPDGLASVLGESGRVLVADFEREGTVRLTSHGLEEGHRTLSHDEIPYLQGY
jgi:DNA repair exonuclease SbcCD nuclease subunit